MSETKKSKKLTTVIKHYKTTIKKPQKPAEMDIDQLFACMANDNDSDKSSSQHKSIKQYFDVYSEKLDTKIKGHDEDFFEPENNHEGLELERDINTKQLNDNIKAFLDVDTQSRVNSKVHF